MQMFTFEFMTLAQHVSSCLQSDYGSSETVAQVPLVLKQHSLDKLTAWINLSLNAKLMYYLIHSNNKGSYKHAPLLNIALDI